MDPAYRGHFVTGQRRYFWGMISVATITDCSLNPWMLHAFNVAINLFSRLQRVRFDGGHFLRRDAVHRVSRPRPTRAQLLQMEADGRTGDDDPVVPDQRHRRPVRRPEDGLNLLLHRAGFRRGSDVGLHSGAGKRGRVQVGHDPDHRERARLRGRFGAQRRDDRPHRHRFSIGLGLDRGFDLLLHEKEEEEEGRSDQKTPTISSHSTTTTSSTTTRGQTGL